MKYRKRPVVIEAYQFTGAWRVVPLEFQRQVKRIDCDQYVIETLEGEHRVSFGDYVVKGIAGEFYPVKPEIFEATYDQYEAPPSAGEYFEKVGKE